MTFSEALSRTPSIRDHLKNGLKALRKTHRRLVTCDGRRLRGSVDVDTANGARVRALVRNPQTAGLPPHVDVVRGDLTLPATLDGCLEGIDAAWCGLPR